MTFLIVIFALSMLYMVTSSRINAMINMLKLQGFILCLVTLISHDENGLWGMLFIFLETFIIKALIIPNFLTKVSKKNNIKRDNNPNFPNFYTLVVTTLVLFGGLLMTNLHGGHLQNLSSLYFGISLATIVVSFLFIATKKKLLTHVIGFCLLENGIFLLSLSVAKEMPMVVNLGVLLDVFVAVFILGLLIGEIGNIYENPDVCQLCNLKDCECQDE